MEFLKITLGTVMLMALSISLLLFVSIRLVNLIKLGWVLLTSRPDKMQIAIGSKVFILPCGNQGWVVSVDYLPLSLIFEYKVIDKYGKCIVSMSNHTYLYTNELVKEKQEMLFIADTVN